MEMYLSLYQNKWLKHPGTTLGVEHRWFTQAWDILDRPCERCNNFPKRTATRSTEEVKEKIRGVRCAYGCHSIVGGQTSCQVV